MPFSTTIVSTGGAAGGGEARSTRGVFSRIADELDELSGAYARATDGASALADETERLFSSGRTTTSLTGANASSRSTGRVPETGVGFSAGKAIIDEIRRSQRQLGDKLIEEIRSAGNFSRSSGSELRRDGV